MEFGCPAVFGCGKIKGRGDVGQQMRHEIAGQRRSDAGHGKDDEQFSSGEYGLRPNFFNAFVENNCNNDKWYHHAPGEVILSHFGGVTNVAGVVTAPGHECDTNTVSTAPFFPSSITVLSIP